MPGFTSPNYTQIPNDLLGDKKCPGMMADMSLSELKVVLAVCRFTFGFHREKVRLSYSTLQCLTGLSRHSVIKGATASVKRELLTKTQDGGVTLYELVVQKMHQPEGELVQKMHRDGVENAPPSIKETLKKRNSAETQTLEEREKEMDDSGFPRTYPNADPIQAKHWTENVKPWSAWGGDAVHARNGVSESMLRRLGWALENELGLFPVDGEAEGWLKGLAEFHNAAGGDLMKIKGAIGLWRRQEEQYRPTHPRGFVKLVRKIGDDLHGGHVPIRVHASEMPY